MTATVRGSEAAQLDVQRLIFRFGFLCGAAAGALITALMTVGF